jgi:hypothetical protein
VLVVSVCAYVAVMLNSSAPAAINIIFFMSVSLKFKGSFVFLSVVVKSCQQKKHDRNVCWMSAKTRNLIRVLLCMSEYFTNCCLVRNFLQPYARSSGRFGISGGAGGGVVKGSCSGFISGSFRGHTRGSGSFPGCISGALPGTGTSPGLSIRFNLKVLIAYLV